MASAKNSVRSRLRHLGLPIVAVSGAMLALLGAGLLSGFLGPTDARVTGPPRPAQEFPVTAMDHSVAASNNTPVLLADPNQPRFVVLANRLDAPDFSCALQVSGDSGRSWEPANPVPELPEGAEKCYGPEVAFDRDGVLYYLFVGLSGRGNRPMGAFLTTSSDRARTFSPPRKVLGPLNFAVRMAMDPDAGKAGRLHLVWLHANSDPALGGFGPPPNPIMAAHSDDGGRTFSEPVQVSDPSRLRVVAPALALGEDNTVHVAYYDLQRDAVDYQGLEGPVWEETWAIVLATSTDGGRRFREASVVDDGIRPPERVMLIFTMPPPSLTADGARVCAAWTDAREGDPDAVLRCSTNGGRTWEPLRRLNDDPVGNGKRQYLPRISLAAGGRLDAVFLDRRRDPRNLFNDAYFTYSLDGGRRFETNIRVTRRSSDSEHGQQYVGPGAAGQFEWGSRLGLMSTKTEAIAAWPDTRNSRPNTTAQDLYSAVIRFPIREVRPEWAAVAGGGLVAGGGCMMGLALATIRRRRSPTAGETRGLSSEGEGGPERAAHPAVEPQQAGIARR